MWLVGGNYGCGYQEVGVVSGRCVRGTYIDFLIYITYPYSTCISSFLQQPTFLLILKMFFRFLPRILSCTRLTFFHAF